MNAISVKYKRNTTGEEITPPSGYMVIHTRPDGTPANEGEIMLMNTAFGRAMAQAGEKAGRTGKFIEPKWAVGGYQIEVLREDDLPLSIHDVQYLLIMNSMYRNAQMREIDVIVTAKTTQAIVSTLTVAGVQAWANATQQLKAVRNQEESSDEGVQVNNEYYEQVVTLTDADGAQMLLDVGLITRADTSDANQYIVPRESAYCITELRRQ